MGRSIENTLINTINALNSIEEALTSMGVQAHGKPVTQYHDLIKSIQSSGTGSNDTNVGELQSRIAELEEQVRILKEQLEQAGDADVAELQKQIAELQGTITSLNSRIKDLEGQVKNLEDQLNNSDSEEVADLRQQISTLKETISSLEGQISSLTTENDNLSNQVSSLQSQVSDLEEQLRDKGDVDVSEYLQRINELEAQVQELTNNNNELKNTVEELNTSIEDKNSNIENLKEQLNTATDENNNLKSYLYDIYYAIQHNDVDVSCDENDYNNYDDAINNIKSAYDNIVNQRNSTISYLNGELGDRDNTINELRNYLSNIADALNRNSVDITVNKEDYNDYEYTIGRVYDAYNSQISELSETKTTYEQNFADIYNAIIAKGGTCTQDNYDTYADGVSNISTNTVIETSGELDRLKSQISGIDFDGTLVITNGNNLFANMPKLGSFFINGDGIDMSDCTDVTDMFKGCENLNTPKIINFGNNVQADLILDLAINDKMDFDNFKNDIKKYTGSYVRKILVTQQAYENNVGWGGVKTLASKGITVEVKPS